MYLKLFPAALFIFLLSACHSNYQSDKKTITETNGKVIGNRFYDSNGWFSVSLPENCPVKISDNHTPNASIASFMDESGNLMRFEIFKTDYPCPINDNEVEIALRMILAEAVITAIEIHFPNTKLTHIEFMKNEQQLFAIIDIPEGSTCVNTETNKRMDSARGYLLFIAGDKLVVISNQFSPSDTETQKLIYGKNFSNDAFLKELLSFKKAFRDEELNTQN